MAFGVEHINEIGYLKEQWNAFAANPKMCFVFLYAQDDMKYTNYTFLILSKIMKLILIRNKI